MLTIVSKTTFAYYLKQAKMEWSSKKYLDYIDKLWIKNPNNPNESQEEADES